MYVYSETTADGGRQWPGRVGEAGAELGLGLEGARHQERGSHERRVHAENHLAV